MGTENWRGEGGNWVRPEGKGVGMEETAFVKTWEVEK